MKSFQRIFHISNLRGMGEEGTSQTADHQHQKRMMFYSYKNA